MRRRLNGIRLQGRRAQRGYALIMVLSALALIAFVAGQFSQRIDQLRQQSLSLAEYAQGRIAASDAQAVGIYWMAVQPRSPDGFGVGHLRVRADGAAYELPGGARLALHDQNALLSLNSLDRGQMDRLLGGLGVGAAARDQLVDVLLDYVDSDNLRRLNGAERTDYDSLGLPPPRNELLSTVHELSNMIGWRDQHELREQIERYTSVRVGTFVNPNVAPLPVLRAALPMATDAQLRLFDTLRRASPFVNGTMARSATGLALDDEGFVFYPSDEQTLTVWAPGMPRAIRYVLTLTPGDSSAPWVVSTAYSIETPIASHAPAASFPLTLAIDKP